MSQFQLYLFIWFGIMVLSVAASGYVKKKRGKEAATLEDFVVSAFALAGAITFFRILVKALTLESLQTELDWDGAIALCISSTLGIGLSLKEFRKLLL